MRVYKKLGEEIPQTKDGLLDYVLQMRKAIKPLRIQCNRMEDLLQKANERMKKYK